MNFKQFIQLDEIFDIASADTSRVNLIKSNNKYIYEFSYGKDGYKNDYKVIMTELTNYKHPDFDIRPTFDITFIGPEDDELTGYAGMSATIIYKHLLLGIKKLMETTVVNSLSFLAASPKMLPIYQLFYNRFLKPDPPTGAGFVRVSDALYVRREILREKLASGLDGEAKNKALRNILNANRKMSQDVKDANHNKIIKKALDRLTADNKLFCWVKMKEYHFPYQSEPVLIFATTYFWAMYDDDDEQIRIAGFYKMDADNEKLVSLNSGGDKWIPLTNILQVIRKATPQEESNALHTI